MPPSAVGFGSFSKVSGKEVLIYEDDTEPVGFFALGQPTEPTNFTPPPGPFLLRPSDNKTSCGGHSLGGKTVLTCQINKNFRYASTWDKTLIVFATIIALASGVFLPAVIIIFGEVIDRLIIYDLANNNLTNQTMTTEQFLQETANLCALNTAFGLAFVFCNYIMVSFFSLAAANQTFKIKSMFMASILKQDIGWHDTTEPGDFAGRITGNFTRIQNGIGEKVCICISLLSSASFCIGTGIWYSWKLAQNIFSVTSVMITAMGIMSQIQSYFAGKEIQAKGAAAIVAEDVLTSIRTVVLSRTTREEIERYENFLALSRKTGIKRGFVTAIGASITCVGIFATYALSFGFGVKIIVEDKLTGGKLIIALFSFLLASLFIGQIYLYFEAFAYAQEAAGKIYTIIERIPVIDSSFREGKKPGSVNGTISMRDVFFNYPAIPNVPVLKGVSLDVRPGETVALVGPSGGGKSTIMQLILRFYDADQGAVHVDENNVKDLNVGWLRDNIGLVGEVPVLFTTTIAENIRYGKRDATQEEIENAAKIANIHDFIQDLPLKYETLLDERGARLSSGQKQRIVIARTLVKDPKILLLDEATRSLDTDSEAVVQAALDEARRGRTTVVVSHSLSTIRTADKIVVLSEGEVKEVGTHEELMEKEGIYYHLVQTQILLNEMNAKNPNARWLRDNLGVVPLMPVLFHPTTAENGSLGADVTQGELENAAEVSGVQEFIQFLPLNYNNLVGEQDAQLSDGQKQIIAIARELVKNPKTPFLDRATSALDTEGKAVVQAPLDQTKPADEEDEELHYMDEKEEHRLSDHDRKMSVPSGVSVGPAEGVAGAVHRQISTASTGERQISSANSGCDIQPSTLNAYDRQMSVNCAGNVVMEDDEDDDLDKKTSLSQARLWKMSAKEWPYLFVGGICALLMGLHFPALGITFGAMLGPLSGDPNKMTEQTDVLCFVLLTMAATSGLCSFLQVFMFIIAEEKLSSRLRKIAFSNVMTQDIKFFNHPKNTVRSLCSALTSDAFSVQGATISRISFLLLATSTLIASVVLAFWYQYKIGLVILAFMPCVLLAAYFESVVLDGEKTSDTLGIDDASKVAIEAIESIRTVAMLHQEETFFTKFQNYLAEPHKKSIKQSHIKGLIFGFAQGFIAFAYAATMYYGSILVANKELNFADFIKVLEGIMLCGMIIGQAMAFAPDYQKAKLSAVRIFRLLDLQPKRNAFLIPGEGLCSGDSAELQLLTGNRGQPQECETML